MQQLIGAHVRHEHVTEALCVPNTTLKPLHEIRSEYAQIMCAAFLLAAGPGPWSLDALLQRRRHTATDELTPEHRLAHP